MNMDFNEFLYVVQVPSLDFSIDASSEAFLTTLTITDDENASMKA